MKVTGKGQKVKTIAFFYLLPFAFCLWILAYQAPLTQTLPIGGDVELRRREDDAPFLRGENGSEPYRAGVWRWWELLAPGERPYRWTTADSSLTFPGVGGGPWLIQIVAASGRPDQSAALSRWQAGVAPAFEPTLPAGPRRYQLLAPADPAGNLEIHFLTPPFAAPGDRRELGFVLHEVRLQPLSGGLRAPAWPQLGLLGLSLALIYGTARLLDTGPRFAVALAGGAALAAAYSLAFTRTALTMATPVLAGLALCCALAAAAGWALTRSWPPDRAALARRVLALTLLAFALRLGGMFHPHALYSDSAFHANNLYELTMGGLLQTAGLPSEAGGGQAPYPTGLYLLLLPGQLLIPPDSALRVDLVQAGVALLDSLTLPLIALLLIRAGFGQAAALFGAACYLLPITALESFAVGELANIGGQALAMPAIALLALGLVGHPFSHQSSSACGILHGAFPAALTLGLLVHSGVTLSLGALVAATWLLALAGRVRGRNGPIDPLRLAVAAAMALALAGLIYYSAPVYLQGILGRLGMEQAGGGPAGLGLGAILTETVGGVFGVAMPRARAWALPALLGAAAVGGLAVIWLRGGERSAGLRLALAAWWSGALISQLLLLAADQGVRWTMFLYPALCLGAGALLAALWRRGGAGRLCAALILGTILAYGWAMWVVQIRDYYHI